VTQASGRLYKARNGLNPNAVHDGYVIYVEATAQVTFLNPTAAAVFELCDGGADLDAIAEAIREAFDLPEPPRADVAACLESLVRLGLVEIVAQTSS
jgi:PqqD family protein of HPr-rel-A system